jgi:hypothetical protein
LDWSKGAILLLDEEKRGGIGRFRQADVIFVQVFLDPLGERVCFGGVERIDFTV